MQKGGEGSPKGAEGSPAAPLKDSHDAKVKGQGLLPSRTAPVKDCSRKSEACSREDRYPEKTAPVKTATYP